MSSIFCGVSKNLKLHLLFLVWALFSELVCLKFWPFGGIKISAYSSNTLCADNVDQKFVENPMYFGILQRILIGWPKTVYKTILLQFTRKTIYLRTVPFLDFMFTILTFYLGVYVAFFVQICVEFAVHCLTKPPRFSLGPYKLICSQNYEEKWCWTCSLH